MNLLYDIDWPNIGTSLAIAVAGAAASTRSPDSWIVVTILIPAFITLAAKDKMQ